MREGGGGGWWLRMVKTSLLLLARWALGASVIPGRLAQVSGHTGTLWPVISLRRNAKTDHLTPVHTLPRPCSDTSFFCRLRTKLSSEMSFVVFVSLRPS